MTKLSKDAAHIKRLYDVRFKDDWFSSMSRQWQIAVGTWDKKAKMYRELQSFVRAHEDALLELILSGEYGEKDMGHLVNFGGHGGSVSYADNQHWHGFMKKVRAHYAEMPPWIQQHLDWLREVHGW